MKSGLWSAAVVLVALASQNAFSAFISYREGAEDQDIHVMFGGFFDDGVVSESKEQGSISRAKYYSNDIAPGGGGGGTAFMVEPSNKNQISDMITLSWESIEDTTGEGYKSVVVVQSTFGSDGGGITFGSLPKWAKGLEEDGTEQDLSDYFYTTTAKQTLPKGLAIFAQSDKDVPDGGPSVLLLGIAVAGMILVRRGAC